MYEDGSEFKENDVVFYYDTLSENFREGKFKQEIEGTNYSSIYFKDSINVCRSELIGHDYKMASIYAEGYLELELVKIIDAENKIKKQLKKITGTVYI